MEFFRMARGKMGSTACTYSSNSLSPFRDDAGRFSEHSVKYDTN